MTTDSEYVEVKLKLPRSRYTEMILTAREWFGDDGDIGDIITTRIELYQPLWEACNDATLFLGKCILFLEDKGFEPGDIEEFGADLITPEQNYEMTDTFVQKRWKHWDRKMVPQSMMTDPEVVNGG